MTPEQIKELQKQKRHANMETVYWLLGASGILLVLFVLQKYILGGEFVGNLIVETPSIYSTIIWICFALFVSKLEAFYYTHEINSGFEDNFNEHGLFTLMRACVLIPLWILTSWKVALCLVAIFPFFHDGNYYRMRNKIVSGTYPKKWFSQSTTSTAWSTKFLTPIVRTVLAAIGIIVLYIIA